MAHDRTKLSDAQWAKIAPLLPEPEQSPNGGPTPVPNRPCLEGILWVLRSGARWKDLPKGKYPSSSTCWRRLHDWEERGLWLKVWRAFLAELDEQGRLDWEETFADGTFSPAKKGAHASARPNVERVRSLWWWQTARVFLWECTLPRPHQMKSRSSKPRWTKSPYHEKGEAVRERIHHG
jgi:transposase